LLFWFAVSRCFSLLLPAVFCCYLAAAMPKAEEFGGFRRLAVLPWKNSEKQRLLAGAPVLS